MLGLKLAFNALAHSTEGESRKVRFESDSQLVVNQLNGVAQCKATVLKPFFERARDELFHVKNLPNVESVELLYIPRRFNPVADQLAKAGINNPVGSGFSSLDRPSFATSSVYEVEKFMDAQGGKILVQWKGYPDPEDFTWQRESELKTDLGRVTFHDMMQEMLMSSAMNDIMLEHELGQDNPDVPGAEHVAREAEAPTSATTSVCDQPVIAGIPAAEHVARETDAPTTPTRDRSATASGPNAGNASLADNVEAPLVRRFSLRVRERQARACLSRTPSAP